MYETGGWNSPCIESKDRSASNTCFCGEYPGGLSHRASSKLLISLSIESSTAVRTG